MQPLRHRRWSWIVLGCTLSASAMLGCGGSTKKDAIWVYQYPSFYKSQLKRIAVLPFGNRTRTRGVGERISDKVSAILTSNGTYEVYNRTHLKDIMQEVTAAQSGLIDPEAAKRIGKLKSVQALVCGVCNRYGTTTRRETRHNVVPVWGRNAQGMPVVVRYNKVPYKWTRYDGFVECNVFVIDCGTGKQIAAVHRPSTKYAAGSPPKYTPQQVVMAAEEDQVNKIVRALAVTRTQIKLEGDVLQTAKSLYDQEWDWARRFTPADEHFFVVVMLPPRADRNNFRITIVPKGEREDVAKHSFVWTKKYRRFGYKFLIKPIVEKRGLGDYTAKLYSGPAPIATYDFTIAEPR